MSERDDDSTDQNGDYEVGYGRPPKHSQYKKGQTGNKKGRPPGSKNADKILHDELNQKVKVKEGDKIIETTKRAAMIKQTVNKAMSGDLKAVAMILSKDYETQQQMEVALKSAVVKQSDEDIIKAYEDRNKANAQTAAEHPLEDDASSEDAEDDPS